MALHDRVAEVSLRQFRNLPKTGKPSENEWTVLSCIVKEDAGSDRFEAVALGTGSKCIGKSKMSMGGDVLNDSHGEVTCRRSFLRYLLHEVEVCLCDKSGGTFVFDSGKLELRNDVRFHFFTTHAPCGDAAIFPRNDDCDDVGNCVLSNNAVGSLPEEKKKRARLDAIGKADDIFRTGAKCLPGDGAKDLHLDGAGYHTVGLIRTKPGRGSPTLSVSCSDKLAKWCYLGVQGALLSLLLAKPIYLSSLTLVRNTPYSEDALNRALHERFPDFDMNFSYRRQKMTLGQANADFEFCKGEGKRACAGSIIWSKDNNGSVEVAVEGRKQGTTKKKLNSPAGRVKVCKVELFKHFLEIAETHKLFPSESNMSDRRYSEVKRMACDYQNSWDALKRSVFRIWTVKNPALLDFTCNSKMIGSMQSS